MKNRKLNIIAHRALAMLLAVLTAMPAGVLSVLAADDNALDLLLRHEDEWFRGVPIVYFGVNNISLAGEAARLKRFYGFYEKDYLEDTLYLAMSLYPDSDKIVALHDDSAAG